MSSQKFKTFLYNRINYLKNNGLYNEHTSMQSGTGPTITINGEELINLCSNNYLGFANDTRLKKAANNATDFYGVGAGSGRLISGSTDLHIELEKKIAQFKGTEDAITFQSGFNSNTTVIPAIMDKNDAILSDEYNHASVKDGALLSKAEFISYHHSDMDDLRSKAEKLVSERKYNKIMIVTSGVFSMDGDLAKLPEIVNIARDLDLITYVDDAHGTGVLAEGAGTVKHFKLHNEIDIQMGTLSKALGVIGGYVAGNKYLVDLLKMQTHASLFSTSLTPASVGASIKAIDILMEDTELNNKLWKNNKYFREGLQEIGFHISNSESALIPCIIGEEKATQTFCERLFNNGVFVKATVFPSVPMGEARIRNIAIATHTKSLLDKALSVYESVGKEMNLV